MSFPIPPQNIAIFLQKFSISTVDALTLDSNYASVGVFTTNTTGARQWQFTFDGLFSTNEAFQIIYDFSKVNTYGYQITFEGTLNGFMNIDGTLYATTKYLKYIPQTQEDIEQKIVRLLFKPPCLKETKGVVRSLYYVTNLNDTSCSCTTTNSSITGTTPNVVLNCNVDDPTTTVSSDISTYVTATIKDNDLNDYTIATVTITGYTGTVYIRCSNINGSSTVTVTNNGSGDAYLWTASHSYYCTISSGTTRTYTWSSSGNGCFI
jgi:hypothetical protein